VTGANSGLGLATASALAGLGAGVVLACRSPARATTAADAVLAAATGPEPEVVVLDLADLASVAAAAERIAAGHAGVDLLVNNAGVMALPPMLTTDGFEMQFGTNHLGPFAFTAALAPLLRPGGRVVTVSSLAARRVDIDLDDLQSERGYDPWVAYGRSKRANLIFTLELHRRLAATGRRLASVGAHPGFAATALIANGPGLFASHTARGIYAVLGRVGPRATSGARSQVHAASAPDVVSGDYYGPRGPLQLWGAPRRIRPPRLAGDPAIGAALWAASEELTGVRFEL
jgi:NAD(P)-dependent dehydrogenase (short-subunit alcohol dehydrogenase family)